MSQLKKLLLGCAVFFLATRADAAAPYMVGTWFGYGQPESKDAMYIDRMRADGSWQGEYRTCGKGKTSDQIQVGRWSLAGDVLSLKVNTVNGMPMPHTDTYKMLAHSANSQKYISTAWNFPYTPGRVADDFQMPSCELVG